LIAAAQTLSLLDRGEKKEKEKKERFIVQGWGGGGKRIAG